MLHAEASVATLNQTKRRKNVPDLPQEAIAKITQTMSALQLERYAQVEGVLNMLKRREYWPEIWSRFRVGVRSFL